ncbi:hypothetical protein N7510_006328 [Penicillium lagena]|uniref:uncharacterized protein n=1 Tax=Penicillium lagena TaxID=94218 RepID=UPI00253FEE68|nr:uncharacterized protein N7510_006328 [Penicillium lagena]KAJ5613134.1 hypothetical protein N7510_006328 [Penicillium lagena]
MSDPTSKKPSIPSWQQQSANPPADQPPSSPNSDAAPSASRQELVDQAARFLEDDSIRDASTNHKVSFLESKGLTPDEIQTLLGVSRNAEATSINPDTAEGKAPPSSSPSSSSSSESQSTEVSPSSSSATSPSPSTTMSQPRSTTSAPQKDVPPIITYPEFLVQSSKPPPLVTMRSVLYTLYGAAGLGASIYGASEFLVKPMLASLTSARHDLAITAHQNLQKLNEKLEQNVSVIPAHLTARKPKLALDDEEDEVDHDGDSVTSDPTELFHRDVATQTTPEESSTPLSSSSSTDELTLTGAGIAVSNHLKRLESIQSQLREVVDCEKDASSLEDSMRSGLTDLHHYLDGLIYSAPAYTAAGASYGVYGGSGSSVDNSAMGVRKAEDDAIAAFKADIRGVKGALLSARNFPASRGGRLGGVPAAGAR